jgi:hypothetical protein
LVVIPPNRTTDGSSDLTSPATVSPHTWSSSPFTTELNVNSVGSKSISMVNDPTSDEPVVM